MTRDEMIEALRGGMCNVTFTKKDGTTRVMPCTLNFSLIPSDQWPVSGQSSIDESLEKTPSTIRVFAPESEGWRSFLVENVQEFKVGHA